MNQRRELHLLVVVLVPALLQHFTQEGLHLKILELDGEQDRAVHAAYMRLFEALFRSLRTCTARLNEARAPGADKVTAPTPPSRVCLRLEGFLMSNMTHL